MKKIQLTRQLIKGAVSLEVTEDYVKPWRIPFEDAALFVPNHLNGKAEIPAGVRITFRSNSESIKIEIFKSNNPIELDCLMNGHLHQTGVIQAGDTSLVFDSLKDEEKLIEIYLSQKVPVQLSGLWIDEQSEWTISTDSRPHWIAYGSSITQCIQAASPSETWPALSAQRMGLNLTCLGYGGNSHMEPMVARTIRDIPADFISLCVGINIMGGTTLSKRTFASALIGFIQIIREKQVDTPITIISPIFSRSRESKDNAVGLNLEKMRVEVEETVKLLQQHGDLNLFYMNGLELFGEEFEQYLPDDLHPDAEGYRIMSHRFQERVSPEILKQLKS